MAILKFSTGTYLNSQQGADIVNSAVELCRKAMDKHDGRLVQGYDELNRVVKESLLAYAVERNNVDTSLYNVNDQRDFAKAFDEIDGFKKTYFSVIRKVQEVLNSKVELQAIMSFVNISSIADGDSINVEVKPSVLYNIETTGYSNRRSMAQFQFANNQVLTPVRKEASIAFDVYQLSALNYDFGEMLRKLVLSFRVAMQKEACAVLFDTTAITGTPFVQASFAKTSFMDMVEKISAITGSEVGVYGTKLAFGKATDSIADKYLYGGLGASIVKDGYVTNLYGTNGYMLDQTINQTSTGYAYNVANDKFIVAPSGRPIVDMVMEGSFQIIEDDGKENSLQQRHYQMITSWNCKNTAVLGAYGVISLT